MLKNSWIVSSACGPCLLLIGFPYGNVMLEDTGYTLLSRIPHSVIARPQVLASQIIVHSHSASACVSDEEAIITDVG
jgi:hypothetical protein